MRPGAGLHAAPARKGDHTRRQLEVHAIFKPRTGCKRRRVDPNETRDVFIRPSEQVMATVHLPVTLMGYVHNREEGRRAYCIMVTADAKSFHGGLCGVGANVQLYQIVEDELKTDVFEVHRGLRVAEWPIVSHALEVKSWKDAQLHPNCNRLAFARMPVMVASDMHRIFRENRGNVCVLVQYRHYTLLQYRHYTKYSNKLLTAEKKAKHAEQG